MTTPQNQKSIKLSFFGLSIAIPTAFITNNILSVIAIAIGLVALYSIHNSHGLDNALHIGKDESIIKFKSTFVFWVPEFNKQNLVDSDTNRIERLFNDALAERFGGFTRWQVQGSGEREIVHAGWFYQTSIPDVEDRTEYNDIEKIIDKYFTKSSFYAVKYTH